MARHYDKYKDIHIPLKSGTGMPGVADVIFQSAESALLGFQSMQSQITSSVWEGQGRGSFKGTYIAIESSMKGVRDMICAQLKPASDVSINKLLPKLDEMEAKEKELVEKEQALDDAIRKRDSIERYTTVTGTRVQRDEWTRADAVVGTTREAKEKVEKELDILDPQVAALVAAVKALNTAGIDVRAADSAPTSIVPLDDNPFGIITIEEAPLALNEAALSSARAGVPLESFGIETGKAYKNVNIGGMSCLVYIPKGATTGMALTYFLHGSSQSNTLPSLIGKKIPINSLDTIVVAPQRSKDPYGNKSFIKTLDEAIIKYGSDPGKIYLTGFSWGGRMALDLVANYPERFARVVTTDAQLRQFVTHENYQKLIKMPATMLPPIVITHSKNDEAYPYNKLVKALNPLGSKVRLITIGSGHGSASKTAYQDPEIQKLLGLSKFI